MMAPETAGQAAPSAAAARLTGSGIADGRDLSPIWRSSIAALPCTVGVSTVQNVANDGLSLTLNPSALDGSAATLSATVGDD
jgi:hypothetical protein